MLENAKTAMEHIYRIARKAILISLDEPVEEYIKNFVVPVYDHSKMVIENAIEDYFILAWTSSSIKVPIRTPMIFIEEKS